MTLNLPPIPVEYLEINFLNTIKDCDKQYNINNLPFAASNVYLAPIKTVKFLTNGENVKSVAELCLIVEDSNFAYIPGQNIGVLPQNNSDEVYKIIEKLQLIENADKICNITLKKNCTKKNAKIPVHLGNKCTTIRNILLYDLDIRSVPKKLFLRALSKYTKDEEELNILNELCSTEGSIKYNNFITNNYVTLLELLTRFSSCQPPFTLLLEHLPKLQPRQYSLASCPIEKGLNSQSEIKFIYSLEILPNCYEGVCTGWLHKQINNFLNTATNVLIPIYLRKTHDFKLPDDNHTNILMIATGTGIAPFLSFLKYRDEQRKTNKFSNFGNIWLFYGCRYHDRDYLYKDELENFQESGSLTKLFISFSRETHSCRYVQDNIKKHQTNFVNYLDDSVIYVCGNKNMCKDVFETIIMCMDNVKNCGLDKARTTLCELKKQNKYLEDIWN